MVTEPGPRKGPGNRIPPTGRLTGTSVAHSPVAAHAGGWDDNPHRHVEVEVEVSS